MPGSLRRIASVLLTLLAAGGAIPAAALAQGATSPFTPGLPQSSATVPTTAATPTVSNTSTTSSDSGLSGTGAIAIAIGALIVLGGISFFIWRDARKRAPVRASGALTGESTRPGSKTKAKPRKLSAAERKRRKRGRAR